MIRISPLPASAGAGQGEEQGVAHIFWKALPSAFNIMGDYSVI